MFTVRFRIVISRGAHSTNFLWRGGGGGGGGGGSNDLGLTFVYSTTSSSGTGFILGRLISSSYVGNHSLDF
jgi:hypothetical protein